MSKDSKINADTIASELKGRVPGPSEEWKTERALEGVNEMFHYMVHSCFEKCIEPRLHHMEPNIGSGEGHCVDRCVLKYFQAQTIAGMRLKRHGLSIN